MNSILSRRRLRESAGISSLSSTPKVVQTIPSAPLSGNLKDLGLSDLRQKRLQSEKAKLEKAMKAGAADGLRSGLKTGLFVGAGVTALAAGVLAAPLGLALGAGALTTLGWGSLSTVLGAAATGVAEVGSKPEQYQTMAAEARRRERIE